jgi:large subunit ribosomal protein L3
MTQVLLDQKAVTATVIEAGPCFVVGVRTKEKDGYTAIALAFGDTKKATKPMAGVFKKASVTPKRWIAEFPVGESKDFHLGQKVTVDMFKAGEKVVVTGISKGKGFTGVVKRHGYSGGPAAHGSMSHAVPGSIGASTSPGRVIKGKGLPGRMGNDRVSIKGLEVLKVDESKSLLVVKGPVAGCRRGVLYISR